MTNQNLESVGSAADRQPGPAELDFTEIMLADARPKNARPTEAAPKNEATPRAESSPAPPPDSKTQRATGAPAATDATPATAEGEPCPSNGVYTSYIDDVASRIYDLADLGDLEKLRNKFNCEIDASKNPFKYIKQALDEDNDPFTSFLDETHYKQLVEEQKGKNVGTGVQLRMPTAAEEISGVYKPVVQEFEATPGRTTQLQPGDEILKIDNTDVANKGWRDISNMLDGAENTNVTVRVLRDGVETDVVLKRTNEELPAVTSQSVDADNFAHIRLRTFMQNDASNELERAILDNPNAKGYIIDLRHNPGGLLDQSFLTASLFFHQGDILKIRSRVPSDPSSPKYSMDTYRVSPTEVQRIKDAAKPARFSERHEDRMHKPYVILTDQGTASAAEILTGALRDTDKAYVIGTPTWGKGVGQTIVPDWFSGGATKVTTFRYFTPNGTWPGDGHKQRTGLQPDLLVPNPAPRDFGTTNDAQMKAAIEYLRRITGTTKP